jgi:hypothetical protein
MPEERLKSSYDKKAGCKPPYAAWAKTLEHYKGGGLDLWASWWMVEKGLREVKS